MTVSALTLFLLFSGTPAYAQEDTTRAFAFPGYALRDSLEYSAETIDYDFDLREIILDQNADINYLGRILKSNTITYFQDYDFLRATGTTDTTGAPVNTPSFTDATGEQIAGRVIEYNLDTQQGVIYQGKTRYEQGYMATQTIKMVSQDTLYIADGTYTTCDYDDPHYYFYGRQMKFIPNDKIIIRPIIAYVHDIPVLWFPYYVFPIARGRQSGFLTPRYGNSREDGRYLSNIGYYFAPSEYFDYRFAATVREQNGWLFNNWFSYDKRYLMSGSIFGSFENEPRLGTKQWSLSGSHRQTFSPTLDMAGTVNLQSSQFARFNQSNLYQVLNRNLRSSLRVTKQWQDSGNSLIASLDYVKNLDTNDLTLTAPDISFRKPSKLLFASEPDRGPQRKYEQKSTQTLLPAERRWYQNIYYTFSANFRNNQADTFSKSAAELALERSNPGLNRFDIKKSRTDRVLGISTQLNGAQKLGGRLALNPFVSLNESFQSTSDSLGYHRSDNLSLGVDLNTKIYGTFNTAIGSLRAIRHVISPSISYSHTISRQFSGTDIEALYRFDQNTIEKPQRRALNLNLRNLFQAKTVSGETENKFDLFSLDFSTAYDFDRTNRRLSPLTTTLDMRPTPALRLLFRSTHDFYDDENEFKLFSPNLTNVSVTSTFGLNGFNLSSLQQSSRANANRNLGQDRFDVESNAAETTQVPAEQGIAIPFNMQIQHFYSRTRTGSPGKFRFTEIHNIKPTVSFSPTKNFSIQYFLYYDLKSKTINDQRVQLTRDLHCWELNLYWVVTGIRQGYYLRIFIKDLPDVKIEQRKGVSTFGG